MDITELVGLNFSANQLACSGVGQAGVLSELISDLQSQIKKGEITKAKEYLDISITMFSSIKNGISL